MRLLILALLVASSTAFRRLSVGDPAHDRHWDLFKVKYNKQYGNNLKEESIRRLVWENNMAYIKKHNTETLAGRHTYTVAENQFADMSNEEFRVTMNGYRAPLNKPKRPIFNATIKVADAVDWRQEGIVTYVKNQGQCGSCWSFSTTGSLEGQHAKATGYLVALSEQNLVDCTTSYGNNGCQGGYMDHAFAYIRDNEGIDTEDSYPYQAVLGDCQYDPSHSGATLNSWEDVQQGDEEALRQAVGSVGPVSVAIDASHQSFQLYSGGVYNEPDCSASYLDHAVLAVGYGSDGNQDYWLVKNSWGESWGEAGYIKMTRNQENQCGIASTASYPVV